MDKTSKVTFYQNMCQAASARGIRNVHDLLYQEGIVPYGFFERIPCPDDYAPDPSDLRDIAMAIGCPADELLGITPVPNLKKPVGEELTAMGLTAATLRKLAEGMLESRVEHAFQNTIPNDAALLRRLDQIIEQRIAPVTTDVIRQKLYKMNMQVSCVVSGLDGEDKGVIPD